MAFKNKKQPRKIRVPYHLALKAYAFADRDFEEALGNMKRFDFFVPDKNNNDDRHGPSQAEQYRNLEAWYEQQRRNASKLNRYYNFTRYQRRKHQIDPFYTWIVEGEDPEASGPSNFVDHIIQDIRNVPLRQAVCVLLRMHGDPFRVEKELRRQTLKRIIEWNAEEIHFFWHFFWDCEIMAHEDWLVYIGWGRPSSRHYGYVHQMLTARLAEQVRWDVSVPLDTSVGDMSRQLVEDLYIQARRAGSDGDWEKLRGLSTEFRRLAKAVMEFADEEALGTSGEKLKNEYPEPFQTIVSEAQIRQENLTPQALGIKQPSSVEELDGDFNDPHDTDQDLDSFRETHDQ